MLMSVIVGKDDVNSVIFVVMGDVAIAVRQLVQRNKVFSGRGRFKQA
jgi:hypothetical protein